MHTRKHMPKEIEVTQAFRDRNIKCCLMVDNYAGRNTGTVVHQVKEVVDDLIIRKVAIAKPLGYEIGDDEDSIREPETKASADVDDVQTGGDPGTEKILEPGEAPVEDVYEEMSWNDLRSAGKEAGINLKGLNKITLKAALRAL